MSHANKVQWLAASDSEESLPPAGKDKPESALSNYLKYATMPLEDVQASPLFMFLLLLILLLFFLLVMLVLFPSGPLSLGSPPAAVSPCFANVLARLFANALKSRSKESWNYNKY